MSQADPFANILDALNEMQATFGIESFTSGRQKTELGSSLNDVVMDIGRGIMSYTAKIYTEELYTEYVLPLLD